MTRDVDLNAIREDLRLVTRSPKAAGAVAKVPPQLFINNKFVDSTSGKLYDVTCPINGVSMMTVAEATPEDINKAVDAARQAFDTGPWGTTISARDRGRVLFKLADLLQQHHEELAIIEAMQTGKPFKTAHEVDVRFAIEHFRYMAGWADKISGSTIPALSQAVAYTLKEPVGVVGAIIPFSYPLLFFAWKVAPALAAGCTVVAKPSWTTPLSALRLADLSLQAGFPPGVLNVVPGKGPVAAALCKHPSVDKLVFTGSKQVGEHVMAAGAQHIADVSMNLGGPSPLIVCPDADPKTAAQLAHDGLFPNSSPSMRVLVHESISEAFTKASVELARAIKIGNPFDENVKIGPLPDEETYNNFNMAVKRAKDEGASLLTGEDVSAEIGYFVDATIFGDVKPEMRIFRDEIYGPLMVIAKYSKLEDAIAITNSQANNFGLAAGVVSHNLDTVNMLASRLRTGTVWVNTWNAFPSTMPYGGYGENGIGKDNGQEGIEQYVQTKSVIVKYQ